LADAGLVRRAAHLSMRPRRCHRGDSERGRRAGGGRVASMRPRRRHRGELEGTAEATSAVMLQCGHGVATVENRCAARAGTAQGGRFNAATASPPWRTYLLDDEQHARRGRRVAAGGLQLLEAAVSGLLRLLDAAHQVGDGEVGQLGHSRVGEVYYRDTARLDQLLVVQRSGTAMPDLEAVEYLEPVEPPQQALQLAPRGGVALHLL